MSVADTIRNQLGGNKFAAMTGARDFGTSGNNLTFRIPGRKINMVQIVLNDADLYDVEFFKYNARTFDLKTVETVNGIYGEDLCKTFTRVTGLETSL